MIIYKRTFIRIVRMYRNTIPYGVNPPRPAVGGVTNFDAMTMRPPSTLSTPYAGPIGNGVRPLPFGGASGMPMTQLYNGGAAGNRQMGMFFASESVKARYLIVPDFSEDGDEGGKLFKELNEGMLLFAASTDNPATGYASGAFGSKVTVAYDIYSLNKLCMSHKAKYNEFEAEKLLSIWQPLGVWKNESGNKFESFKNPKSSLSRIINVVVGHRVKTHNIWGGRIEVGSGLYVICKKVKINNKRSFGQSEAEKVWQFIPYVNSKNRNVPPLSELKYIDNDGSTKYGAYTYIGMASEPAQVLGLSTDNVAVADEQRLKWVDDCHTRLPPNIELYVAC